MYKNIYNTQFYFIKEKHFRVYSQLWAGVQFIYFYAQQKKKKNWTASIYNLHFLWDP